MDVNGVWRVGLGQVRYTIPHLYLIRDSESNSMVVYQEKKSFAYKLVIRIYKIKPLVSIIFVKH